MFYPLVLCSIIAAYLAVMSDLIPGLPTSDDADMFFSVLFVIILIVFGSQAFAKQNKGVAVFSFLIAILIFVIFGIIYSLSSGF